MHLAKVQVGQVKNSICVGLDGYTPPLPEGFELTPVTTEDELNALEQTLGDVERMRDSLAWLQAEVFDSEPPKRLDEARGLPYGQRASNF